MLHKATYPHTEGGCPAKSKTLLLLPTPSPDIIISKTLEILPSIYVSLTFHLSIHLLSIYMCIHVKLVFFRHIHEIALYAHFFHLAPGFQLSASPTGSPL